MRLEPSIGLDLCPVWRDMLARSVIFKKSAGLSIGGVGMQASEQYFLGHSPVEQRRLQQQAQELAQESTWLFDQIGIGPGSRVVEIGWALRVAWNSFPIALDPRDTSSEWS